MTARIPHQRQAGQYAARLGILEPGQLTYVDDVIGVLVVLGLYLFVIIRSLEAARLAKDRLGAYLVAGIIAGFSFQVIYNIAMSVGLAPVKGITLPLMSYGGSSLIATMATFRHIHNVRMRRLKKIR